MQGNILQEGSSRSNQIYQLTGGYGQRAIELTAEGWSPYLLVLKFRHLGGRRDAVIAQMHREAARAYRRLSQRVWRDPDAASRRALRPLWVLTADVPVAKHTKVAVRELIPNDGLHLQGVAVMPPDSRLRETLDVHLGREGSRYCPPGGPLISLHATAITSDLAYVNKYNFKAHARGRASFDDILILPVSSAELSSRPRPATEPWRTLILDQT